MGPRRLGVAERAIGERQLVVDDGGLRLQLEGPREVLDRLVGSAEGAGRSSEAAVRGGLRRAEPEDALELPVGLLVVAEGEMELGQMEEGREVAGPKLEGALVRRPLGIEVPDHLTDESEVVRPPEVARGQPGGVAEARPRPRR